MAGGSYKRKLRLFRVSYYHDFHLQKHLMSFLQLVETKNCLHLTGLTSCFLGYK